MLGRGVVVMGGAPATGPLVGGAGGRRRRGRPRRPGWRPSSVSTTASTPADRRPAPRRPRPVREPPVDRRRTLAPCAGYATLVRPPALPHVGQHVRHAGGGEPGGGRRSRRPASTAGRRPPTTGPPTSSCPTDAAWIDDGPRQPWRRSTLEGCRDSPRVGRSHGLTLVAPPSHPFTPRPRWPPISWPPFRHAVRRRALHHADRLGQDARAHRAPAPPPPRSRLRADGASPSPTTSRPNSRSKRAPPTSGRGCAR